MIKTTGLDSAGRWRAMVCAARKVLLVYIGRGATSRRGCGARVYNELELTSLDVARSVAGEAIDTLIADGLVCDFPLPDGWHMVALTRRAGRRSRQYRGQRARNYTRALARERHQR